MAAVPDSACPAPYGVLHFRTMRKDIQTLAETVLAGGVLSKNEARLLTNVGGHDRYDLFFWANRIRLAFWGDKVTCCSIVANKVGQCSEDCKFCSQSSRHATPQAGTLTILHDPDLLQAAAEAKRSHADSFGLVASGVGPTDEEIESYGPTLAQLSAGGHIRPCASLGVLTEKQARRLVTLGAKRGNHNLQTSRRFFPNIITTHTYDDRLNTLRVMKEAGLSLCSGALFGMGENWDDRLDLAFDLLPLQPDVVPLNFLIPIEGTALQGTPLMRPMEGLHCIALYRFLFPKAQIKIAGGRELCLRELQSWMFLAGANSFLIGNYLTTSGRAAEEDLKLLADLELAVLEYEEEITPL